MEKIKLGVNIDHIATLRNARGGAYPDPIEAALIASKAGADFITAHLREDRRHINDMDLIRLKDSLSAPLNLEIAATNEMINIASELRPHAVCLVPENRAELTTEGGLNVIKLENQLKPHIYKLKECGIKVTLFLEPDLDQAKISKALEVDNIEIHTGLYCDKRSEREMHRIAEMSKYCIKNQIGCHAGHGLDYETARIISQVQGISALNIGHFLMSVAIFEGLENAIRKMRKIINAAG